MKMIKLFASFSLVLSACVMDTGSDEEFTESEVESSVGSLVCVSNGPGFGSCTASDVPSGWTISPGPGTRTVTPSGTNPKMAGWRCFSSPGTATVTAVGVGSATVQCRQ